MLKSCAFCLAISCQMQYNMMHRPNQAEAFLSNIVFYYCSFAYFYVLPTILHRWLIFQCYLVELVVCHVIVIVKTNMDNVGLKNNFNFRSDMSIYIK
jgi:hypothetical protein